MVVAHKAVCSRPSEAGAARPCEAVRGQRLGNPQGRALPGGPRARLRCWPHGRRGQGRVGGSSSVLGGNCGAVNGRCWYLCDVRLEGAGADTDRLLQL